MKIISVNLCMRMCLCIMVKNLVLANLIESWYRKNCCFPEGRCKVWKFEEYLNKETEEKRMNTIMFWEMIFIPITAWAFVHFLLDGGRKDDIVLLMAVCSIFIRIFEKKLGKYAKYFYISIMPVWGPIIIVFTNDGKFSAIEYAYLWAIIICIAGYDLFTMIINAVLTVGLNIIAMILFPEPYLQMHHLPLWSYILLLYVMSLFTSLNVHQRLRKQERIHEQMEIYKKQMEVMRQTEKRFGESVMI